MMFTIFDIIIFTIIGFFSVVGLYKGLLGLTISLLYFMISLIGAFLLAPYLKLGFIDYIEGALAVSVISIILAYVVALLIMLPIKLKATSLFGAIRCSFFDRILGGTVGFLGGVALSILIFTPLAIFSSGAYLQAQNLQEVIYDIDSENYSSWLSHSKTSIFLEESLKNIISILPEDTLSSIKMPTRELEEDQGFIEYIEEDAIQLIQSKSV